MAGRTRSVHGRYGDPLDEIWETAAERLGIRIVRSGEVYASWDGLGTLTLSSPDEFDPDDSLAQLIYHELCHALVAGPDAVGQVDWGLCNESGRDLVQEHATHRVQAALARRWGLRALLAPTTDHRSYWDFLPDDPLAARDDPAAALAREAIARAVDKLPRWLVVIDEALEASAAVAAAVRPHARPRGLYHLTRPLHPAGFVRRGGAERRCTGCAWIVPFEGSAELGWCRHAVETAKRPFELSEPACVRFEEPLDDGQCGRCGACCHHGFDRVEVEPGEPFERLHLPLLATDSTGRVYVPRPDGRCVALDGDGQASAFRCRVYDDRPRACADFDVGGSACLDARRRVGLAEPSSVLFRFRRA